MSKADAQRAMREANYARNHPSVPSRQETTTADEKPSAPSARKASPKAAKAAKAVVPSDAVAQDARCGHKSMNNRACTRDAGHPEKSHRYS
ncbi:MAG: hypothetical protein ACTHWA_10000 [Arachnia sp.]